MKAPHAAALALIGWYLLIPPVITTGRSKEPNQFVWSVPLSLWHRVSSFDDADDCEKYMYDVKRAYEDPSFRAEVDRRDERIAEEYGTQAYLITGEDRLRRWYFAQCIASDDPRLKGR